MTDSEKLVELRQAFKVAVLCACSGDNETLTVVFPSETLEATTKEIEQHLAALEDNISLEDYFRRMMEL